jgi:hypothetical protein
MAIEGALEKNAAHRWLRVEDMLAQLDSDQPTKANRERRALVAARTPTRGDLVQQATVPIHRRPRAPRIEADTHNAVTRDIADRDQDEPSLAAPPDTPTPPEPRNRWIPRRQFLAGAAVGGVIAVLLLRQLTSSNDKAPAAAPEADSTRSAIVAPPIQAPAVTVATAAPPPTEAHKVDPPRSAPRDARPRATRSLPQSSRQGAPALAASNRALDAILGAAVGGVTVSVRERALVFAGDSGKAAPMVDSALALDARNGNAYILRARLRIARGDVREAWTDIELAARTGNQWEALALSTMLNARQSGARVAREQIEKPLRAALTPRQKLDPARAVGLAAALVATGDTSTALTMLELAAKDRRLPMLLADPLFTQLRSSSRFDRLLRQSTP